jgi:putative sterol carrier protein
MPEELTVAKLMELMPRAFLPEKATGVNAEVQFRLTGEGGGDWIVTIRDGTCTVRSGSTEAARLTLTAVADDYLAIVNGKLDPMSAFAQGKIKLKGDLALAMKLMGFFKIPA